MFLVLLKWCFSIAFLIQNNYFTVADDSQVCLKGKYHKPEPEPEIASLGQCGAWQAQSCCTNETAHHIAIDKSELYNFNYSHCGAISQKCLSWFVKDHCFYECSPNLGPWLTPVNNLYRKERFINLPLCQHDCVSWWDACKFDKTCLVTWSKGFNWTKNGNMCPEGSNCDSIETLYHNSTYFCEHIYGPYDFKVVSDPKCMSINFTGKNPNTKIAKAYAKAKLQPQTPGNDPFPPFHVTTEPVLQSAGTIVSVVLAALVLTAACVVSLLYFVKWLKQKPFWRQGVPFQFKEIIPSKRSTATVTNESEMSFMRYDEDEEEEPELNGALRMEL